MISMPNMRFRNLDRLTASKRGDDRTLSIRRPTSGSGKVMERCPADGCQPSVFQLGMAPEDRVIEEEYINMIESIVDKSKIILLETYDTNTQNKDYGVDTISSASKMDRVDEVYSEILNKLKTVLDY